ncbi:MAG: SIS domain-containing protein, partial [Candidatus Nitrosocaldus sp.]
MCSIFAYKGYRDAAPLIVKALSRMEYRGYDSVGIATYDKTIMVKKGVGNVSYVNSRLNLDRLHGRVGIGHTRWATHGAVSDTNAHPHLSCNGRIAVVHNGIVENYATLRHKLASEGHVFSSDTDSEVIAHLLEDALTKPYSYDKMLGKLLNILNGSYSFVALINDGMLVGARYHEPLIIGLTNPSKDGNNNNGDDCIYADECFIASDVLAFIEYTDKAVFLADGESFLVNYADTKQRVMVKILDRDGNATNKEITQIAWEFADVDKGRFAHYTLKEIHEQSYTIDRAFNASSDRLRELINVLINADRIIVTGSGSSYHAALIAKHLFSKLCMLSCDAIVASEFIYSIDAYAYANNVSKPLLIAISQSGETADVLNAVRIARGKNFKIASIVNAPLSTLA